VLEREERERREKSEWRPVQGKGERERREERQRKPDKWAPPPHGVHVSKTTRQNRPMAKYECFES